MSEGQPPFTPPPKTSSHVTGTTIFDEPHLILLLMRITCHDSLLSLCDFFQLPVDHLGWSVGLIILEQRAIDTLPLCPVDEHLIVTTPLTRATGWGRVVTPVLLLLPPPPED